MFVQGMINVFPARPVSNMFVARVMNATTVISRAQLSHRELGIKGILLKKVKP